MTENDYLNDIIKSHKLPTNIDYYTQTQVINPLCLIIENWASRFLDEIVISGSRAKGTAIDLSSDLDLFISLSPNTPYSLEEIYNELFKWLDAKGLKCRKQNVSIRVYYNNKKVDLVPAKRQDYYSDDHSLYRNKKGTWTQTNIKKHINNVLYSNRINEIVALKIWRENHGLDFPSIYLETYVIEALKGRSYNDIANNIRFLFNDIKNNFMYKRIVDPSNTNNVLSDDLSNAEKKIIVDCASKSLEERYWDNIIW